MIKSGIADTFRNEQYIKKPDFLYEIESMLLAANLNSNNIKANEENLVLLGYYILVRFVNYYQGLVIKPKNV